MGLLRPPAHRMPLIAAGSVLLAAGILLLQLRLESPLGDGVHLLVAALPAALLLALAIEARPDGGGPSPSQSVLAVTALVLAAVALVRLADVLGAGDDGYPSGAAVWTSLLLGATALAAGIRLRSAMCVFIASLAAVSVLLNLVDLLFDPGSATGYRVLLVLAAIVLVLVSLVLRGGAYRTSVLLVSLAGLLIFAMGVTLASLLGLVSLGDLGEEAGTGWELILLIAACGLIGFGAVDRQPGPAAIGVLDLALFVALTAQTGGADSLRWWPLLLLLLGAGVMAAGLRPARPLPPEPEPYPAGDRPLASRTDGDETVVSVQVD